MRSFTLICFDVADDRRLRHIANALENHGQRVQRSVFECRLDQQELFELKRRLGELLDPMEDHVRYYALCPKDLPGIMIDGPGEVTQAFEYRLL